MCDVKSPQEMLKLLKNVMSYGGGDDSAVKRDICDILEMRTQGDFYAACETRWSMIQVDQLVLDENENGTLMKYVTNHYWKDFAYQTNFSIETLGVVFWRTRMDSVFDLDDETRVLKYGSKRERYPQVKVPYVLPYGTYDMRIELDEHGRDVFKLIDKQTGDPMDDVYVSKGRRGCFRHDTRTFTTDCGAVLGPWRRFREIIKLHDEVTKNNAKVEPYLESRPLNDPTRLASAQRDLEKLLHIGIDGKLVQDTVEIKRIPAQDGSTLAFNEVPDGFAIGTTQPRATMTFDLEMERRVLKELYASVLQLPTRFVLPEQGNTLRTDSEAAVSEDTTRMAMVVSERRNEVVDVLREAYFACYENANPKIHLPTKKSLKVENLVHFNMLGILDDDVFREEVAMTVGMKRERFTDGPLPHPEREPKVVKKPNKNADARAKRSAKRKTKLEREKKQKDEKRAKRKIRIEKRKTNEQAHKLDKREKKLKKRERETEKQTARKKTKTQQS